MRQLPMHEHIEKVLDLASRAPLFADFSNAELQTLLNPAELVMLDPGETLTVEGVLAEYLYLLVEGSVAIFTGQTERERVDVVKRGPSEAIGEMSLILNTPSSATAQAVGSLLALRFDRSNFLQLMRQYPDFSLSVSRMLVGRLYQVTQQMVQLYTDPTTRLRKPALESQQDPAELLAHARTVLEIESEAILGLQEQLDEEFVKAVTLIEQSQGRVIVTGMGKSGLIGRKIAATLSSTGTPALFLHPAEGVHGDLGVVTREDVVLAISNSGETVEILGILPTLKRIGPAMIALTGKPNSTLAKQSNAVLQIAVKREACPLNLAPTASAIATLAMGDALAIVLLERRGFTAQDFALFHPAGALGKTAQQKATM